MKTISSFIILFLYVNAIAMAQKNHLFVLKFEGEPYLLKNDTTEVVSKGAHINKKTKLVMKRDDIVFLIDHKGDVYELHETGTFKFKELKELKPVKNEDSYVKNLMSYFWKDFTNTLEKGYNKSGVVVRGDYVKLLQPIDSVNVFMSEITFEWEAKANKSQPYYFVLRPAGTDHITKIGTHDNSITLFIDDINLTYGNTYDWTVVESKFDNLKKADFSRFQLLSKAEHTKRQDELRKLSQFLSSIGFESDEIETMLCVNYKTCL